jgi:nucleoside-diphosphate-sugar epimerase
MAASYGVHGILREHYAKYELPLVLVTGVSGFVAGHVALALLETKRYRVWGTVRDLKDKAAVGHLSAHPVLEEVFLVEADLLSDAGWEAALEGCAFCVHCASPFPWPRASSPSASSRRPSLERRAVVAGPARPKFPIPRSATN